MIEEEYIETDLIDDGASGDNGDSKYKVKLKEFEGPLDLLLYLIRNAEINIYDVSISEITEQYLNYLSLLITFDMDNISEFIEMASTLIWIKSKTLLPVEVDYEDDDDRDDPREELIAKLLEYEKYKMASGILEERQSDIHMVMRKNNQPVLFDIKEDKEDNWIPLSVIDLVGAFTDILNSKEKDKDHDIEILQHEFTIEEKIDYLLSLLYEQESLLYFEMIREGMSKLELICSFLAILELVKQGVIEIKQHKIFGDIHIFRKKIENYEEKDISF